jgi:hypothetical protein
VARVLSRYPVSRRARRGRSSSSEPRSAGGGGRNEKPAAGGAGQSVGQPVALSFLVLSALSARLDRVLHAPRLDTSRRYRATRSTRIEIQTKIALDLSLRRLLGPVSWSSSLSSLSSSSLLLLSFREKCVGTVCPPFFTPGDSTHPGDRGDARASSRTSTIDLTPVREHRVARVDDPREARFLPVKNDRRLLALDRKIRTFDRWDAGEATRSSHHCPGECGKFLLGGSAGR